MAVVIAAIPAVIGAAMIWQHVIAPKLYDAEIHPPSEACTRDVDGALRGFRADKGMREEITDHDVHEVIYTGTIRLQYFVGGEARTAHFRVQRRSGECRLVSPYTSLPLPNCECRRRRSE